MFGLGKNTEVDIDPIAEAEIYFAYGRNEAAIKLLQDAYNGGNAELQSKISAYLDKNNKSHLVKQAKPVKYQYRVHCVEYVNGFAFTHKFYVIAKNSKNTFNGMRDIENEAENKINKPGANWVISYISEALE